MAVRQPKPAHRFRTINKNTPAARARAKQYASREHRQLRASWQRRINAGEHVECWRRCGTVIRPGMRWHLGHDDHDRRIYRGPECVTCNLKAAARAGNKAQREQSPPRRRTLPAW